MAQQQGLILLQPYLTLEAQHCQRIPQVGTGIAECYEFTIPANGLRAERRRAHSDMLQI